MFQSHSSYFIVYWLIKASDLNFCSNVKFELECHNTDEKVDKKDQIGRLYAYNLDFLSFYWVSLFHPC